MNIKGRKIKRSGIGKKAVGLKYRDLEHLSNHPREANKIKGVNVHFLPVRALESQGLPKIGDILHQ